ncbi:winged helix-turn-helix transcriptional regulator [Streptomyces mutabilis]
MVLTQPSSQEVRCAGLQRRVPGISRKMLSVTLRNPVRGGLVTCRVDGSAPHALPITELGLSLEAALPGVRAWAEEHMTEADRANELSHWAQDTAA